MNIIYMSSIVVIAILCAGSLYIRLAPLSLDRLAARYGPYSIGTHILDGGVKYVIPLSKLPKGALDHLAWIALESPRTKVVHQEHDVLTLVTRSLGVGFPDITMAWLSEGALHIHAHLVYGRLDLGVNKKRVDQWLAILTDLEQNTDTE